uniref:Ribosome biogenesis protein NOP53 n=1 Tax=Oryzias latipes TaxID=8090 RepID=H2LXK5_ORYLA
MAAARRLKRVAVSQPGFLGLKSNVKPSELVSSRRKRVNKNKKKNWNRHSDIHDVEDFLEDIRHQERTTGGLLSEKPDDSLFFLDVEAEPVKAEKGKRRVQRPLRIDLILQHDSMVPAPKNVTAYQQPNAKKLRRIAQKAEQLAAKGVLPRRQRRLLSRRPAEKTVKKAEANNNPDRDFYAMWGEEKVTDSADPWYLQQTGKKLVQRPEKLNQKPSVLPAVEVIAPGGSYNPDFLSHQALLQEAHDVEVQKQKQEDKLQRQLAFRKEDRATEVQTIISAVAACLYEDEDEAAAPNEDEANSALGAIAVAAKKTERQRKKEKAEKMKTQQQQASRRQTERQQQLFQLRSIKSSIKQQELQTKARRMKRKARQEAQKALPRRLGRLKYAQDLEVQLSDELAASLRQLKPEGSVLKDRFKSLQKRNLIEPRERAKFKRRLKVKYVEKRAFRQIT